MRLWIDDARKMPKGFDLWFRTYSDTVRYLYVNGNKESLFISFDHDLGNSKTGYDIACFIELLSSRGMINEIKWEIHSANPVGRKRIEMAMKSAERFWKEKEDG